MQNCTSNVPCDPSLKMTRCKTTAVDKNKFSVVFFSFLFSQHSCARVKMRMHEIGGMVTFSRQIDARCIRFHHIPQRLTHICNTLTQHTDSDELSKVERDRRRLPSYVMSQLNSLHQKD